ncbi:glucose-6-phosphate dehydrogenase assembly protein OpcA [Ruania halotolerans]|uniref:glucose-6-phosphate dehydrogenase assembly protein OpcA n=1 Tax=Ruania halotolerans TaxID=2897773 RepID=UPI001E513641|nr:glucose-6-phosphate dehydrogenase assembly protein OpcA [Ruania halotolerans]UFU08139.1 glucose-6-phosphate dehydrogenase assembly protein OpcA [Ruania halotolerans]
MIITLKDTTTAEIGAKLVRLREEGGAVALGRVLTLVIVAEQSPAGTDALIEAANQASKEHPCRVIVVDPSEQADPGEAGLDAEIRIGGDAGASDVVVLRPLGGARTEVDTLVIPLLLPDAPIVVWWPKHPPEHPGEDPLGRMAQRRISDVGECADSITQLTQLGAAYTPGDTDLSWARTTLWRGITAAALDDAHEPVRAVRVLGSKDRPSTHLFAAWLAASLDLDVTLEHEAGSTAITGLDLERADGTISMRRPEGEVIVSITQPNQPDHELAMPKRALQDCLMEDLRRMDPDAVYQRTLLKGLPRVRVREGSPA